MKKGFTLIELLVVVLIIGILAAIALPQYQKAVNKSRFAGVLQRLRPLMDAQERYYLANGEYALQNSPLDIDVFSDCVRVQSYDSLRYYCPYANIDANNQSQGKILVHFCPASDGRNHTECVQERYVTLTIGYQYSDQHPSRRDCDVIKPGSQYLCDQFKQSL